MLRPPLVSLRVLGSRQCSNKSHQWIQPEGYDTGVKVYNCVAREKVPLIVRNRSLATFYTCGPTVYDDTHLGHASCYVKLDILQRLMRDYFGVPLLTAMNVTDIDDKIIRRAQETAQTWSEVAQENEQRFWRSLDSLGVVAPDCKVRVTEHLPEITNFIQRLLNTGHAYPAADSSVYFDCSTTEGHGKLSQTLDKGEPAIQEQSGVKKASRDFALWKAVQSGPMFETEFGAGRPGWHIECSAMATKVFGDSIDFHGGGWDLKFPHHENEESQSCAFHGTKQWVNYWLHTGQLRLQGATEKMSKSLKNTISVDEFLKSHSANDFRMFCLLSNYRSNTEYSDEGVSTARRVHLKIQTFLEDLRLHLVGQRKLRIRDNGAFQERLTATISAYDAALRDDFDTARAIRLLIDLVGIVNRNQHGSDADEGVELDSGLINFTDRFFRTQLRTLGLEHANVIPVERREEDSVGHGGVIDTVLEIRNELRRRAKKTNDKSLFFLADHIRKQLEVAGIEIKDRDKQTTTWTTKK